VRFQFRHIIGGAVPVGRRVREQGVHLSQRHVLEDDGHCLSAVVFHVSVQVPGHHAAVREERARPRHVLAHDGRETPGLSAVLLVMLRYIPGRHTAH